jgi:two-component system, NarL family, sensor kinase
LIIISYVFKKKKYKYYREKVEMEMRFNEALLRAQLEIREQTLKTISQEIHDNIGQTLTLAKLNLALAEKQEHQPGSSKIADSHMLVKKAIQDLRSLSRSFDTDYVSDMGLQRSIEYELEMISKTGAMATHLYAEGTVRRMEKQKELILFRIVQESLNNIIKHANASQLDVTIKYLPEKLFLSVTDNGQGVDLSPLKQKDNTTFGLGIRNMHSRAQLIGAEFNISSTLGKGTEVTISIPNT